MPKEADIKTKIWNTVDQCDNSSVHYYLSLAFVECLAHCRYVTIFDTWIYEWRFYSKQTNNKTKVRNA